MVLGGYLQHCWDGTCVAIQNVSDHLCNLKNLEPIQIQTSQKCVACGLGTWEVFFLLACETTIASGKVGAHHLIAHCCLRTVYTRPVPITAYGVAHTLIDEDNSNVISVRETPEGLLNLSQRSICGDNG